MITDKDRVLRRNPATATPKATPLLDAQILGVAHFPMSGCCFETYFVALERIPSIRIYSSAFCNTKMQ